jgi:hypothetical protein
MLDYRSAKIDELKRAIEKESGGGIDSEQLEGLKKKDLWQIYKTVAEVPEESEEELPQPEETISQDPPNYGSKDWADYVVGCFTNKELNDGNPNITGLRRVGRLLLGEVIESRPVDTRTSLDVEGPGKAVVTYKLVFDWMNTDRPRIFGAVASSWIGNTDDEFAVFVEAMAETRAETRAYRKALLLDKVSAEELTSKNTSEVIERYQERLEGEDGGRITGLQEKTITSLCDRLNIDVTKFINNGSRTYDKISSVPYENATKMIMRLNDYQNANEVEIPEEIKNES